MSTIVHRVEETVERRITVARWTLGLTGVLSIAWAITILVWPDISLYTLVILFGAYSLAKGIIGLGAAISGSVMEGRGWLALSSIAGIVIGVLVFLWTDMSALALLYVIGAYAITLGILAIWGAFTLPLDQSDAIVLGVSGAAGILFGIVMFAKPGDGALVLLALIAAYALVTGVAELVVAIGGKRLLSNELRQRFAPEPSP